MARTKETNTEAIWRIFMNAPGHECAALYADATKILASRNIIKPPRKREVVGAHKHKDRDGLGNKEPI